MARLLLAGALLLAACDEPQQLEVPDANVSEEELVPPPLPLQPSYVSSPIVFDLRPILQELEAAVPRQMGSIEKDRRIRVMGTPPVSVAPELRRSPFRFTFSNNQLQVASTIRYRARAWSTIFRVSCGMGDTLPRMRVRISMRYNLTRDWRLATTSKVEQLEPVTESERDQCEISALKINVAPRVARAAQGAVEGELKKLDAKLGRISVRNDVEKVWLEIQKPISLLQQTLWLVINPREVSLGRITPNDSTLVARLDLLASPEIRSGARPVVEPVPLPSLGRTRATTDTADVRMEGLLTWEAADSILARKLVGRTLTYGFKRVKVTGLAVRPAGRGRVLLDVTISGTARGTLHVIGSPRYDPVTDEISIPDLAFDVASAGYLARAAVWLLNSTFEDDVRTAARIRSAALMDDLMRTVNKEVNRELTGGVGLRGELSDAKVLDVYASRNGLVARATGAGRLWIEISKQDLLPEGKVRKLQRTAR